MPLSVHLQGPCIVAPRFEDSAQVGVDFGMAGLEADRLAALGDGLVLFALTFRALPSCSGPRIVRLQPDRRAVLGDGLSSLPCPFRALPRP